jgi:hypothetical protein
MTKFILGWGKNAGWDSAWKWICQQGCQGCGETKIQMQGTKKVLANEWRQVRGWVKHWWAHLWGRQGLKVGRAGGIMHYLVIWGRSPAVV